MKKMIFFALVVLIPSVALAQHNELDYRQRIQHFFDAESPLCLGEKKWPVASPQNELPWVSGRMQALVDAGLAHKHKNGNTAVYRLSTLGEKHWRQHGDLCYGRMKVDVINKVERINKELTVVYFTYRITALASWAHNRSLRFAFSELDQLVAGIGITRYSVRIRETSGGAATLLDYPAPVMLDY